jgi:hypothetical protein
MKRISSPLPAILALALLQPGAIAQPAPANEALVEQLLAVLPDRDLITHQSVPPPAPAEVSRLNGLNPGHEADVMEVLNGWQTCVAPAVNAALARVFRRIVAALGEAKTRRMIEFYRGPDLQSFTVLGTRQEHGEALSAVEQRTLQRIFAAYPVEEFAAQIGNLQQMAMRDDAFLAAVTRCSLDKQAELARRGLRPR